MKKQKLYRIASVFLMLILILATLSGCGDNSNHTGNSEIESEMDSNQESENPSESESDTGEDTNQSTDTMKPEMVPEMETAEKPVREVETRMNPAAVPIQKQKPAMLTQKKIQK